MKNPKAIIKKIPKPVRKMIIRAAADTAAGKLVRKVFDSGTGQKSIKRAARITGSAAKLQSIHGSKASAVDRLADLGLTAAVTGPIRRLQQRKRRTDIAATAAVALTKVLVRVKWK